jgi:hypothetical protein
VALTRTATTEKAARKKERKSVVSRMMMMKKMVIRCSFSYPYPVLAGCVGPHVQKLFDQERAAIIAPQRKGGVLTLPG